MERHFEEELKALKEKLLFMGSLVEESIHHAVDGLVKRSTEPFKKVFKNEDETNKLHLEIDETCIKLLALRQPMAMDLRFITAAMKINGDLERMGDQAINIAQNTEKLLTQAKIKPIADVPKMADIAKNMVKDSIDAFVKKDEKLAQEVLLKDDEVDDLKNQIFRELIDIMIADKKTIERALDLILIARNLERIGDHATNIAEEVIFMVLGKDIRHHSAEQK